jgi:hypothetical protein
MAQNIGDRLAKSQRQNVLDRRCQIHLQVSDRLQLDASRCERIAGNGEFVEERRLMPSSNALPDRRQCIASYAFHLIGFLCDATQVRRGQSLDELASHDDGGEGLTCDVVDVAGDPFPLGDGGEMSDPAVLSPELVRTMVP